MTREADAGAFYDEMWRRYGHLDAKSPAAFHRRRLICRLARSAAPGARRVLDAGAGQGELIAELARAFPRARVSGSDVSEQSLADTRRRSPETDLFLLDLADPDFKKRYEPQLGKYDLVVASEVIEHIPEEARAAHNLFSLLRKGGVAIVTVPGGKMSRFDELIGHQRHYRPERLEELLTRAGFSVEAVHAWGFPFHNLYRSAVRVASRASMPERPEPQAEPSRLSALLSRGYALFGRGLKPLFYLNISHFGEQMLAVARRPA